MQDSKLCKVSHTYFEELDPSKLIYRGEGNNSIILANPETGYVYRFRKTSSGTPMMTHKKTGTMTKQLHITRIFRENKILEYFGTEFTPEMKMLEVDTDLLEAIDEKFLPCRPEYRIKKRIDYDYAQILVAPDATCLPKAFHAWTEGPTFSIEIKPKLGCMPQLQLINPTDCDRLKLEVCKFCMLQYHQSKRQMWPVVSQYCPCDLFSGVRSRMLRALRALLISPQINMRVFQNGSLIFNHETNTLQRNLPNLFSVPRRTDEEYLTDFLNLVVDTLLYDFTGCGRLLRTEQIISYDCALHPPDSPDERVPVGRDTKLPAASVLGRVLAAQLLSSLDTAGALQHYSNVKEFLDSHQLQWDWKRTLSEVHELRDQVPPQLLESCKEVEQFLIGLVARDCSMMIAMRRALPLCPPELRSVVSHAGGDRGEGEAVDRFVINATVVDLDPKPFHKMEEHHLTEQDILRSFLDGHHLPTGNNGTDVKVDPL